MRKNIIAAGLLAFTTLAAGAGIGAGAAAADPVQDSTLLSTMQKEGVPIGDDGGASAIELAHATCNALGADIPFGQLVSESVTDGGMTSSQSSAMVGISVGIYCPEYANLIQ
ncbi:DUF732 domain-containing protein [Speluncibacter jeojiensis]|uniref:DUF732 domain-containing protein n=1 Tax=Speluncibacter jeojiensis TaxID=2710754 RepID=A0A9X4M279_9ACTN|nr:DUF732 domain-containing protein [Corynebacteriales bacterium D3-21]